jgi:anti-sigma factor RsiW
MGRPLDKHIDEQELDALVSSSSDGQKSRGLSPESAREAMRHVESCSICRGRVAEYRRVVSQFSNLAVSEASATKPDCPHDVDWHEVAAGLWPESKATQLIMHAATCEHCGPLLRAATNVSDDASPEEERLLAQLKTPSRPVVQSGWGAIASPVEPRPAWHPLLQWKMLAPALALLVIVGFISVKAPSSRGSVSGPKFAELAVDTHRQYVQGRLALDVHSDSQQMINQWFEGKTQFAVALPASPALPGEERPYRLKGARVVQVGGKAAAFIAYQMQAGPVSLIVTPDSVAVASGGTQLNFKKVSFHYGMFEGYKVVTWSVHGLTYALVSQEGKRTQQSCMVCHSAMRDRDLSQTPTPLYSSENPAQPVWQ